MIVSCPSCCTHYRHAEEAARFVRAHCSRCDERFFIGEPKRTYLLMPVGVASASVGAPVSGMSPVLDDALLAHPESSAPDWPESSADPLLSGQDASGEGLPAPPVADPPAEISLAPARAPRSARRRGPTTREGLVVLLLTTLGGALSYHASFPIDMDMPTQVAAGAGVGLLVGWIWFRWAMRRS